MRKIILLLFFAAFSLTAQSQSWEKSLPDWMEALAGDGMLGRGNDRPEINKAADWLADQFKSLGLKPGNGNSYFQEYYLKPRNSQDSFLVKNVIGILPAKKKSDEYLLLTAHYDHLGIGRAVDGDSIYNGANDNASGVLAMMGIAASLQKKNINRNIVIIAFSGEEMGLRGSRYFANNPTIDLKKTIANFNFEW